MLRHGRRAQVRNVRLFHCAHSSAVEMEEGLARADGQVAACCPPLFWQPAYHLLGHSRKRFSTSPFMRVMKSSNMCSLGMRPTNILRRQQCKHESVELVSCKSTKARPRLECVDEAASNLVHVRPRPMQETGAMQVNLARIIGLHDVFYSKGTLNTRGHNAT